jgi:hypothetical protein
MNYVEFQVHALGACLKKRGSLYSRAPVGPCELRVGNVGECAVDGLGADVPTIPPRIHPPLGLDEFASDPGNLNP